MVNTRMDVGNEMAGGFFGLLLGTLFSILVGSIIVCNQMNDIKQPCLKQRAAILEITPQKISEANQYFYECISETKESK